MKHFEDIITKLDEIHTKLELDQRITVSMKEAAEILGVGQTTVKELCYRGDLPSLKIGARRLIRRETLEEFARQKEEASANV